MQARKRVRVCCPHCGYCWLTRSRRMHITCPNCLRQVRREEAIAIAKMLYKEVA